MMNFKSAYHIGSVWGIPLKIHISLFLLLGYISLRALLTGTRAFGLIGGILSVLEVVFLLAFIFLSIGLHELGHSFIALRKGCKVREITLLFFGGAAVMEQIPRRPKDEILMAAAGPAVSACLAAILGSLAFLFPLFDAHGLMTWIGRLIFLAALANGILAIFNLLPAYPMDGGRILRAALTPRLGRLRATRLAATAGRVVAIGIAAVALLGLPPFFPSMNLPLLFLAGFVFYVGNREYRQVQLETLMEQRGFAAYRGTDTAYRSYEEPPDENTVLISPPPYQDGPSGHAHIERLPNRRSFS
jgi:Zn-dependent protease